MTQTKPTLGSAAVSLFYIKGVLSKCFSVEILACYVFDYHLFLPPKTAYISH